MCPLSMKVNANAKNDAEAMQYPEYSAKPLIQKPNILEEIPIRINTATNIKKNAAIYPENL